MRERRGGLGVLTSAGAVLLLGGALSACDVGTDDTQETSVFSVEPGQCFESQTEVHLQISQLTQLPCSGPHGLESYSIETYTPPQGVTGDAYPGDDALNKFAQGACAESFGKYVGISYLDSSLYYTYLVPSPRSWEDDDRSVVCFVVAAGKQLEGSAQGSKL